MIVETIDDAARVAVCAADLFAAAVASRPGLVAALPTGRTPIRMYAELAARSAAGSLDASGLVSFNLDEVLLPRTDERTFFSFMTRHAWNALRIAPRNRRIPDGETADPLGECDRYEAEIAAAGGLDLAVLGIGADGHVAYNLPGQVADRTHIVDLDPATIATLGGPVAPGLRAITMGMKTIGSARRLILIATGPRKAEALRRMRDDPAGALWPATLLRDHADLLVLADREAAAQL